IHITDEAAQQAHTGQSPEQAAAAIYTDRRSDTADAQAGYLDNRFDAERVQNEIDLQTSVSQDFAPIAAQGVAVASDYLGNTQHHQHAQMLKNLLEAELRQNHSEAEKAELRADLNRINQYLADNQAAYELWKEGGIGRALLHAGAGGLLTGSADGALGAGAAALSAPHLEALGNHLGGTGKAVVDTLGGAAIGWMAGGTGGAVTGSNADWHNRQLHDNEIAKIKQYASLFAHNQGISIQQATDRLMAQAMRQVDANYRELYANSDTAAEDFLRRHTGNFMVEGKRFLEFSNMGYDRDPSKFSDQNGYREERIRLYQQPAHTEQRRKSDLNDNLISTISGGSKAAISNTPSRLVNGLIGTINGIARTSINPVSLNVPRNTNNPMQGEVENWLGDKIDRAISIGGSVRTVQVAPGMITRHQARNVSTAKQYQSTIPRNLQEQIFAKSVRVNPLQGRNLDGMNTDPRFPQSAGFQKMQATQQLSTGEKIIIHYQYNHINKRVYDLKFDNRPFNIQDPSQPINSINRKR
ncbi:hypothetical protein HMPREF9371_2504, partial [Neisseria shayeganii 871]